MKRPVFICIAIVFLTLISCEDIFECVINRRPQLPDKSFEVGLVNLYYRDAFDAEIKNEPDDNAYAYEFHLDGNLPEGLEMHTDFRTVTIEGSPQNDGTYTFTIFLYVDPPLYYDDDTEAWEDSMCSTATSKTYSITINP